MKDRLSELEFYFPLRRITETLKEIFPNPERNNFRIVFPGRSKTSPSGPRRDT
jgi:hypothetical protein